MQVRITPDSVKIWHFKSWRVMPMRYIHGLFMGDDVVYVSFSEEVSRRLQQILLEEDDCPEGQGFAELTVKNAERQVKDAKLRKSWSSKYWTMYSPDNFSQVGSAARAAHWLEPFERGNREIAITVLFFVVSTMVWMWLQLRVEPQIMNAFPEYGFFVMAGIVILTFGAILAACIMLYRRFDDFYLISPNAREIVFQERSL